MNESKARFGINQKIVALTDSKYGKRKKGCIYRALELDKCPHCGVWSVDIGDRDEIGDTVCVCGFDYLDDTEVHWHLASAFAPYDPPRLEIPAELLEVTSERIDCKPEVKEVV